MRYLPIITIAAEIAIMVYLQKTYDTPERKKIAIMWFVAKAAINMFLLDKSPGGAVLCAIACLICPNFLLGFFWAFSIGGSVLSLIGFSFLSIFF